MKRLRLETSNSSGIDNLQINTVTNSLTSNKYTFSLYYRNLIRSDISSSSVISNYSCYCCFVQGNIGNLNQIPFFIISITNIVVIIELLKAILFHTFPLLQCILNIFSHNATDCIV